MTENYGRENYNFFAKLLLLLHLLHFGSGRILEMRCDILKKKEMIIDLQQIEYNSYSVDDGYRVPWAPNNINDNSNFEHRKWAACIGKVTLHYNGKQDEDFENYEGKSISKTPTKTGDILPFMAPGLCEPVAYLEVDIRYRPKRKYIRKLNLKNDNQYGCTFQKYGLIIIISSICGGLFIIILCVAGFCYFHNQKKKRQDEEDTEASESESFASNAESEEGWSASRSHSESESFASHVESKEDWSASRSLSSSS